MTRLLYQLLPLSAPPDGAPPPAPPGAFHPPHPCGDLTGASLLMHRRKPSQLCAEWRKLGGSGLEAALRTAFTMTERRLAPSRSPSCWKRV